MPLPPEKLESVRPFKLVKFFSFSSLAVIFIFTFALTYIISDRARTVLLKKSEEYALLLAENLNHQVYLQFVVPTAIAYGSISLREPEQFSLIDRVVRNTIHSFRIDSVNIYDAGENIIVYSTDPSMVGKRNLGGMEYKLALRGQHSSQLVSRGSSWVFWAGGGGGEKKLKTYIPFRHEKVLTWKTGPIMGVFEITQELSLDYETIQRFLIMVVITSTAIMMILFVVLRLIVARADRIIYKRVLEQRKLEEQLHQAEKLASLGKMVAAVSHEIKSPLGIIRSTAELLENKVKAFDPRNRLASIVVAESNRLNRIVTEFLDFARPQIPHFVRCNVIEIIEKNLNFLDPELNKSAIRVEKNFAFDEVIIDGDPDLLYRVLLNIFVNAIQAMPDGGDLMVGLTVAGKPERLEISVRDTGTGISPEDISRVFEPFFTTKHKGSGLGLAIVKNIVEGHGGTIRIENEAGKGAMFIIDLPVRHA
ncbi:MAG: ATP-binding protein [Desulfovibrionales bacterium]|nr:ATP-binding protein [Desulfovibrionales bacterium]